MVRNLSLFFFLFHFQGRKNRPILAANFDLLDKGGVPGAKLAEPLEDELRSTGVILFIDGSLVALSLVFTPFCGLTAPWFGSSIDLISFSNYLSFARRHFEVLRHVIKTLVTCPRQTSCSKSADIIMAVKSILGPVSHKKMGSTTWQCAYFMRIDRAKLLGNLASHVGFGAGCSPWFP